MKLKLFITLFISSGVAIASEEERPNFVWMMSEDVSPHFLALYNGGKGASTPNVERLAKEGIIFNNAYSNAPVSSAARSTLITGCYAPKLGVSFHRKLEKVSLPEGLYMFPSYLRKAGYHTSNAAKTDYNCFIDTTAWDVVNGKMGEWRNRKDKKQPFFFVRTNGESHESRLHFPLNDVIEKKTVHDPDDVNLLPSHPDTELFRYTYARFYDQVNKVDAELGKLISMLDEDGELDNTFIFYFGDNGGSLPGTKGYTFETGLKVPLVVYIPKNWRDKLPVEINSRTDACVSFMDFGPTLLKLAGIDIPEKMDGIPFLGEDISTEELNKKDEVYCYGDRFDELYAFNRTVRKGKYKYSRNFTPYHPKSLFAFYRYKQEAFREWKQMFEKGLLNLTQSSFFLPQGAEELYDLSVDPYETNNLATDEKYKPVLKRMRNLLMDNMSRNNDLGILPEAVWLDECSGSPFEYGVVMHDRIVSLLEKANWQLSSFSSVLPEIRKTLCSPDPVERYWALTACASFGDNTTVLKNELYDILRNDKCAYNKSRALVAVSALKEDTDISSEIKAILGNARNEAETLQILNDAAYLKEQYKLGTFNISDKDVLFSSESIKWRLNYLNE